MIADVYHGDKITDIDAFMGASDFAVLKATQGTGYTDPKYDNRAQACKEHGVPFWAYMFMTRNGSAEDQVAHLLDVAGDGYVGLCIDAEDYKGTRPTRAQVQEAYDAITSRGIKCMVYYMDGEAGDYHGIAGGDLGADWIARYGRNDGTYNRDPSTACDLHQYTEKGRMPGVSGDCDLSRVTGTGKALEWFRGVQQTGWIKSGERWWYRHDDGSYTTSGWELIDGKWYLFDADGWMLTGWQQVNGKWYYLTDSGAMATGWLQKDGKWYYLDPDSGAMHEADVANIGGKWYAFGDDGEMQYGAASNADGSLRLE